MHCLSTAFSTAFHCIFHYLSTAFPAPFQLPFLDLPLPFAGRLKSRPRRARELGGELPAIRSESRVSACLSFFSRLIAHCGCLQTLRGDKALHLEEISSLKASLASLSLELPAAVPLLQISRRYYMHPHVNVLTEHV